MADVALTDITLSRLTPPQTGQIEIWDSKLPGFGIRVSKAGTKSFVLVYRHKGVRRRLTLGRYPTIKLAAARRLAGDALKAIAAGADPHGEKLQARRTPKNADGSMFAEVVDEFVERHCKRFNKPTTIAETSRVLRADFVAHWRKKTVSEITKRDVLRRIDTIMTSGRTSAAVHAYAVIRKFFVWCAERDYVRDNPCLTIKRPAPKKSRERVLTDCELIRIWQYAGRCAWPFGAIVRLLVLTAQRRGEVTSMRWPDIDLNARLWTIPAALTKSNRAHVLPLSGMVAELIMTLPRLHDTWVFPARGDLDQPWFGFNKSKPALDKIVGVENWTLHDLRRTAATGMAKLKVAPHVVERILNHTGGTFAGVAGVYNRFGYLDEMREALERWELHLKAQLVAQSVATGRDTPAAKSHVAAELRATTGIAENVTVGATPDPSRQRP